MKIQTKKILAITFSVILLLGIVFSIVYFGFVKQSVLGENEFGFESFAKIDNQYSGITLIKQCPTDRGLQSSDMPCYLRPLVGNPIYEQQLSPGVQWVVVGGSGDWNVQSKFSSQFWDIKSDIVRQQDGIRNFYLSGGDNHLIIERMSWGGYRIDFKPDLKDKQFRVNYKTSKSEGEIFTYINGVASDKISFGSSGLIEIIPNVLKEGEADLLINGVKVQTLNYPYTFTIFFENRGNGIVELINPRYSKLFDCTIDNDEVVVFDEFTENSLFDINSLKYHDNPLPKFCANTYPVIVRSFDERGATTDKQNTVLTELAIGKSVRVPAGKTIRVQYITPFREGMSQSCPIGQAINTKTDKCQDILSAGIPDDYVPYVKTISVGENEISYTMKSDSLKPIVVGDLSFQTNEQKYSCDCPEEETPRIVPPNPSENCWKTTIGNEEIQTKETKELSPYIQIYYEAQGNGVFNSISSYNNQRYFCTFKDASDWINVYKLIIDKEGLKINLKDTINSAKLNENKQVNVQIDNKIANFQDAGVLIRNKNLILDKYADSEDSFAINKGLKDYPINLKTDMLGDVEQEVIPYVIIDDKKFYASTSLILKYTINEEGKVSDFESPIVNERPSETPGEIPEVEDKTPLNIKLILEVGFGILIFLIVLIIITLKVTNRKR